MGVSRKQLGEDDRRFLEMSLNANASFAFMARKLSVSDTTISREVKRNSAGEGPSRSGSETCEEMWRCESAELCTPGCEKGPCSRCKDVDCTKVCTAYKPRQCPRLARKPFVCNGCAAAQFGADCGFERRFYTAHRAQALSDRRHSESRAGINLTADELVAMVSTVKPLLKKGQSLEHIWATHPGEFPVTSRTFYTYVEMGVLDICNMDLPKKVRYRKRKKKVEPSLNPLYEGRRYSDFELLPERAKANAVEMDCVEGSRGSVKVILTLLARSCNLQAMVLLPEHTRMCVQDALDSIERAIGLEAFREVLGLILTD